MPENAEGTEELTGKDRAEDAVVESKTKQRRGEQSRASADKPSPAQPNHPDADSAGNVPADKDLTGKFLKLSGYAEADLMGSNQARRSFVTTNGGKYVLIKKDKAVRVLSGPPTPNMIKAAEELEEDEDE